MPHISNNENTLNNNQKVNLQQDKWVGINSENKERGGI